MYDYDDDPEDGQLELIFSTIDPMQARIAHDLLQGSGLETFIFDGEASRMLGTTVAVESRLMARAYCADEARERLKELGFIR